MCAHNENINVVIRCHKEEKYIALIIFTPVFSWYLPFTGSLNTFLWLKSRDGLSVKAWDGQVDSLHLWLFTPTKIHVLVPFDVFTFSGLSHYVPHTSNHCYNIFNVFLYYRIVYKKIWFSLKETKINNI